MIKKAALAGLLAAAMSLGAGAYGIRGEKGGKVLTEAANTLRHSDPTTASNLDEIAQRGESVSAGEQAGLSDMDRDTLNRAASDLRSSRPDLARKLDKIVRWESRHGRRRGLNGMPGAPATP